MAKRLSILNDPPKLLDGPQLLHELVSWESYPNRCAIDFSRDDRRKCYSYQEMKSCVVLLVLRIQEALSMTSCEAPQHIVPVLLPQSPALYITYLAILISGGAFCPINPNTPIDRIKFISNDVEASLLFTNSEFEKIVTWENGPRVIVVDEFISSFESCHKLRMPLRTKPDDLAYVMYTSGSTGVPKGVRITHLAASQSLLAHEKHIPPFKRFLQFAAPSFDISLFEIFFPLKRACTIVGCSRKELLKDLINKINELDIDVVELTPSVVGSLIEKRSNVPRLNLVLTIGEPLTIPIVREFGGSKTERSLLYGLYDPTEATLHCTIYPAMGTNTKPNNIGVPLDTVSTLIVVPSSCTEDAVKLQILPIGELGELILTGPQLAQGYLHREEQEKIVFIMYEGRKYYRTGDKAKQLEDGSIEIYGRITEDQVKVRGQRIELGEIENAIYKHSEAKVVTAMVIRNTIVVFSLVKNMAMDSEELITSCSKWLPQSMLPNEIILRNSFPYLPSGKVDKKRLESEYLEERQRKNPSDKIIKAESENLIRTILYETLGSFPTNSRLSSVGLDSLTAIRISSKLRTSGFSISATSLLKLQNFEELIDFCISSPKLSTQNSIGLSSKNTTTHEKSQFNPSSPINKLNCTFPCTPQQIAMLSESEKDQNLYHNWLELEFPHFNDYNYLIQVIHNLSQSNPILRTGFIATGGPSEFVQFIHKKIPDCQFELVKSFKYVSDESKDNSLEFPIRFQILLGLSNLRLLVHLHHAMYDAWSVELLLDDLDSLLASMPLCKRSGFELIVNSSLEWENSSKKNWLVTDYWKDHLAHFDPILLPNFCTNPVLVSKLSRYCLQTLISTSKVEAASRRLMSSSQSIFQAAFSLILSSYVGNSDICFGSVFSGRTLPIDGIENIIGPCFTTLPIRIDVGTSSSLHDLVQQLNSINRKHLNYVQSSLRKIKMASGFQSRGVLFDTLLIWQQTLHPHDYLRKHVSLLNSENFLEFNLVLEVIPHVENIELRATYQQQLIPESQIKIFLYQIEQLTKKILETDKISSDRAFSFLEPNLLSIENKTPEIDIKSLDHGLHSSVEGIALKDPNRLAVCFAHSLCEREHNIQNVSYSELNIRANKIGHYLVQYGILPDQLICICLDKSVELYICIVAIIKLGAAWLPVLPDIPLDRLKYVLKQSQTPLVITHSNLRSKFISLSIKTALIDKIDTSFLSSKNLSTKASLNNLAYAIFTSGSTGEPKGVLITQGNVFNHLLALKSLYPASKKTRFLQSCSHTFDVSVTDIFFTWSIGGCLCSATNDVLFQDLEYAIRTLKVTHLSLTPTVAALIDSKKVPCVEFLVLAGEALTSKVYTSWVGHGLWAGYGPTETTNIVTVRPLDLGNYKFGSLGYLLKTTSAFVLSPDDFFNPVPRGGKGELCFGGSQVFRGYMNKTHERGKFIMHQDFGRIYRTGDYGRLLPDGSLEFLGRNDDQVKIRGYRVGLGEINDIIMSSIPETSNCVTLVIDGQTQTDQRLVCFWTSNKNPTVELKCLTIDQVTVKTLRKALDSALPSYMIPSAVIPVSFIPITVSGKIDSSRLINLFNKLSNQYLDSTINIKEPLSNYQMNTVEKEIAAAVAQVTNKSFLEIDADISFFSLGFDSITAIHLSKILRQKFRYQLTVSEILRFPSVIRLAVILSDGEKLQNLPVMTNSTCLNFEFDSNFYESVIKEYEENGFKVQNILPCTSLQESMLSTVEFYTESMYQNKVIFKIRGSIPKLEKCWQEMVRRHEILRTCFKKTELQKHVYVQVVLTEYDLQFGIITKLSKTRPQHGMLKPPYSLDFLRTSEIEQLVLSMHHALYDAEAMSILYDEIQTLYYDRPLELPISFSHFLRFQEESTELETADIFWTNILKSCVFPKFKYDLKKFDSIITSQTHKLTTNYSLKWIDKKCMEHETSLRSVLMAVWACILSERLEENDVCFGNVVSGRSIPIPGIERLVAPCFNTIPSRLRNIHDLSYIEAFRIFQRLNAETLPFQFTPLRRIQYKVNSSNLHIFDTILILQNPEKKLDDSIWSIVEESCFTDIPLICEVIPKRDDEILSIYIHSLPSVIPENISLEILQSFHEKLHLALQNPRQQLLSIDYKVKIFKQGSPIIHSEKMSREISLIRALSEDELKICGIIADFSDVPAYKIRYDDNFFHLGLDSINITQFIARLKRKGYSVFTTDILEHPTVCELTNFLREKREKSPQFSKRELNARDNFNIFYAMHCNYICRTYNISREDIEAIRPCTSFQQGIIARTIQSDGKEYFNFRLLEFSKDISVSKLKEAWAIACQKHEIFRTGLAPIEDIKFPFAMITYRNFTLPWIEDANTQAYVEVKVIDKLLRSPWGLFVRYPKDKIEIKFCVHHALYDATSIEILFLDVASSYRSVEIINRPPINKLLGTIMLQSQEMLEEKKLFWQREENKIILNRFPDLNPIKTNNTESQFCIHTSKLKASTLEVKCRENSVTMQCAAQAAWARLLTAYIGESTTTFGITLSGRSICENADIIPFPSTVTLPTRCNVSGTNQELLASSMEFNSHVYRHQFTPLSNILKWSDFPSGRIFDTLLTYRKLTKSNSGVQAPWKITQEYSFVDYVLSLDLLSKVDDTLELCLNFKVELIPPEQALIILHQYEALLIDILSNPFNACDIAPQESLSLLSITAAKQTELPGPTSLTHEFVEFGARNHPRKVAFEFATSLASNDFSSKKWTYEELNQISNKVSNFLLEIQVEPGDPIAICFEKCAEATFAIIGIMKVGCICVALDPNSPVDRLKFILEDSGAKKILTNGKPLEKLTGYFNKLVIILDLDRISRYSQDSPILSREIIPSDISYIIYTSGTTGIPKGCLLTHENIVHFIRAFTKNFDGHWTDDSKFLQFASYHFDVSIMEHFWSWSIGICVVSAPRDLIFEDITSTIQAFGVTHIDLTPSLARLIRPEDVPSLCHGAFITGGEQLQQEILDTWGKYSCIYNGYGPTEATIGCTMNPRVSCNGKPANIGPAFVNTGTFVLKLDTELPVLQGGIGELCISGKLISKGYLNCPELTAQKFPTLKSFNEKVYRTGDLVRMLHDGSFIFLGRADSQVKLRGQRLELEEIKKVILKNVPEIDQVVILILKHKTQNSNRLVLFFVSSHIEPLKLISDMQSACITWLPGYMVPTYFIPVKIIPLNINNKVDVKKLSTMYDEIKIEDLQKIKNQLQQEHAWSSRQLDVLSKISSAIGVEVSALSQKTNIYELGLDSISMIKFCRALQNYGLENASLSIIRNNPSMDSLVTALLSNKSSISEEYSIYMTALQNISAFSQKHLFTVYNELGVESKEIESISPCTPLQEGMIYKFLQNEHAVYFNKFIFRLRSKIDTEKLLTAWNRAIRHLEILRIKFVATNDGFCQVVMRENIISWVNEINYDSMDKIHALRSPYCLTLNKDILTFQIFHGLYDEISLKLLLNHVINEYYNIGTIFYGPSFISSLAHGPLTKKLGAKKFWSSHFKELSSKSFVACSSYSQNPITASSVIDVKGFETLRQSLGVAPQAIIEACWISVLQTYFSLQFTLGVVVSGRLINLDNVDLIVGPLLNTVPFNIKIRQQATLKEIIFYCQDFNMKMQDFQFTSIKEIQKWIHEKHKNFQKFEIFQSIFNFQRESTSVESFSSDIWDLIDTKSSLDYPLALEARLSSDSNQLSLTVFKHNASLINESAIDLLKNMESYIRKTIDSVGENKISSCSLPYGFSSVLSNEVVQSIEPSVQDEEFSSSSYLNIIKKEISALSQMDYSTINESTSIYQLGLDSIDVIKLFSRLKKNGIEISVSDIITCQTISRMACKVKSHIKSMNEVKCYLKELSQQLRTYFKDSRNLTENIETILPATPLQQSMVNEMMSSGFKRYFNTNGFRISKNVDLVKLKDAIKRVVDASPILRTTFHEVDDPKIPVRYAQFVHKCSRYQIQFDSKSLQKRLSLKEYLKDYTQEVITKVMRTKILLYFRYIIMDDEKYLIIAISHALYDGISLQLIHEDIKRAYNSQLKPRPDFKPYLEKVFTSVTENAKLFWKARLANIPESMISPREILDSEESRDVFLLHKKSSLSLPVIETFCKSSGVTIQTIGQTCWALVLCHLMKQLDVVFGSVLSCRDSEEANEVVFPLMNTVILRSVIHGNLGDMLKYMQEMSDVTRHYQHFPLNKAQAYALSSRGEYSQLSSTSLFDSLFIYQGRDRSDKENSLYEQAYGISEVEFPICVELCIIDNKYMTWTTACKPATASHTEARKLLDALEFILERVVSTPESPSMVYDKDGVSICGLPKFYTKSFQSSKEISKNVSDIDENSWSKSELIIRKALYEMSGVPEKEISKNMTIYHLGLDSILVLKLPALLKTQGIKMSVKSILNGQTITEMAKLVEKSDAISNKSLNVEKILVNILSLPELSKDLIILEKDISKIQYVMPALAGQYYMIRQWQISHGAIFFAGFAHILPGRLNETSIESAWSKLLLRHDILRTGFLDDGTRIFQVVYQNPPNHIIYNQGDEVIKSRKSNKDLRLPPVNLIVEKLLDDKIQLILMIHHALYDGISIQIILREFLALYYDTKIELPTPCFKAFVVQSFSSSQSSGIQEKWKAYLGSSNYPPLDLVQRTVTKRRIEFRMSRNKIKNIKDKAKEIGLSIDSIFLAVLIKIEAQKRFQARSMTSSITIGLYVANRGPFGDDLSQLPAPTLNILPLRALNPLDKTLKKLALELQNDIHKIIDSDMVSASLSDIYNWTGTQVYFCVNILKGSLNNQASHVEFQRYSSDLIFTTEIKNEWLPLQVTHRLITHDDIPLHLMTHIHDKSYIPTIEFEALYNESNVVDIIISAPDNMMTLGEAETLAKQFIEICCSTKI
ncbi:Nonribosomal peptide synthetase 2 [Erysiphe neolycopersici]|uniref:Nonribosomal peptide synthetase 2 n=1 Tax=Erysiphe neolycopersici TaxID=212602 RepID=A0A420I1L4_9PEZI|nr:Nonribosomal peptide synthetase 2 [Erysiphe neolycopersici]